MTLDRLDGLLELLLDLTGDFATGPRANRQSAFTAALGGLVQRSGAELAEPAEVGVTRGLADVVSLDCCRV